MALPFPLSDRATDVRPGCKTQRITPTSCRLDVRSYQRKRVFQTCIVGHVNCCLQCGPTLRLTVIGCHEKMMAFPYLNNIYQSSQTMSCHFTSNREYTLEAAGASVARWLASPP
ncbi:hypothetical protein PoB_002769300 [Plakobranchus ocellatus]|uniref:Uncharacterized protein n=1 Tax=Plakobranchus ocellatus TaxID=259542 RepID=A0AAV4A3F4_9GAST|nr:hypothetical protein PoB_002769300 [Plakobranchus ocellatus]